MSSEPLPAVAIERPTASCAVHPGQPSRGVCSRCGRFACLACLEAAVQRPRCVECVAREPMRVDFGGWLWLMLISLGAFPLTLLNRVVWYGTTLRGKSWPHRPLLSATPTLRALDLGMSAVLSLAAILCLVCFARRDRRTPTLVSLFILASFAEGVTELVVTGSLHVWGLVIALAYNGAWLRYFIKSEHVREVFGRNALELG